MPTREPQTDQHRRKSDSSSVSNLTVPVAAVASLVVGVFMGGSAWAESAAVAKSTSERLAPLEQTVHKHDREIGELRTELRTSLEHIRDLLQRIEQRVAP